ncbi:hypothetical protein LSM04_001182 [Trypanosoma melophagium]|uniref:uncharacterized protein n=1 Tax=Trypanosoma melophagium TaxID=715481 RepID=UPI003519FD72|nr:hypothetical protein LSM04_001182 [Trypanosoma melophagium]
MSQRLQYTREELLALRETIPVHTFPDPVSPNCPMHTDSELVLLQTTVKRRQKESNGTKSLWLRPTNTNTNSSSSITGVDVATGTSNLGSVNRGGVNEREREICRIEHPDAWREREDDSAVKTVLVESNIAEKRKASFARSGKLVRPPPLEIPFVTIVPRDGLCGSTTGDCKGKTAVDVDMERVLIARLRQQQELGGNLQIHQFSASMTKISHTNANSTAIKRLVTPPVLRSVDCSHSTPIATNSTTNINVGGSIDCSGNMTPEPCTDTAVPINNISLFRSHLRSRYFNFTRSLGISSYLSFVTGAENAFSSRYVTGTARKSEQAHDNKDNNNNNNNSNNTIIISSSSNNDIHNCSGIQTGCQSSIASIESGVTPVHLEKSVVDSLGATEGSTKQSTPDIEKQNQQMPGKKPRRRRTNRTHAEKRAHRRANELLLQQKNPLTSEGTVEKTTTLTKHREEPN